MLWKRQQPGQPRLEFGTATTRRQPRMRFRWIVSVVTFLVVAWTRQERSAMAFIVSQPVKERYFDVVRKEHPYYCDFLRVIRPDAGGTSSSFVRLHAKTAKKRLDKNKRGRQRRPSKVTDPAGPTPDTGDNEFEMVDPDDIPGLKEVRDPSEFPLPVPHQPWRRGETAGCEAPIAAEWRREAETIIKSSAELVGARVLDVTWYLTSVVVTLDEEMRPPRDFAKASGPAIDIVEPANPRYSDPADPNPDDLWGDDDDEIVYRRETEEEAEENKQRRINMYAPKDEDDDPNEPHIADAEVYGPDEEEDIVPLYMNEETREDAVLGEVEERQQLAEEAQKPLNVDTLAIDTAALSTIAKAIIDSLDEVEDELQILTRHELILTSPGASDVLETQRQFDAYRGFDVIVETIDPFKSNRVLKGKLVDRNSMDVIINKAGRMVTIPLNFVKCVRLPPAKKREKGVPRDAPF